MKIKQSNAYPQIVLVTGPPRCGTTLLAGMASGGDAYPMLPECTYVTQLAMLSHNQHHYGDAQRLAFYYGTPDARRTIFRSAIAQILEGLLNRLGEPRNYLVLKDPELCHYLAEAALLLPGKPKILVIVRDPRDAVASLLAVRRRSERPASVQQECDNLLRYYYGAVRAIDEHGALAVRFEDLVRLNTATLDVLENRLGYSIGRNGYRELAGEFDSADPFYVPTYGRPVDANRVGAHLATLSDVEVVAIEHQFALLMDRFGYSRGL